MTRDTLPAHPDRHAEEKPDRIAYVMAQSGEAVTYRRLVEASRRIAGVLRRRGVCQGEAVAILIENHPRFMEVAWAAQRSGLRYTAISTRLTPDEIAYILRDSGRSRCSQARNARRPPEERLRVPQR